MVLIAALAVVSASPSFAQTVEIGAVRGDVVLLRNESGERLMDISRVDWNGYERAACKMMVFEH
jgi:hypothetical protein